MLVRPCNIDNNFFEQTAKDSESKKWMEKSCNFNSVGMKKHVNSIIHGCLSCRIKSKADPILAVTDQF